MPGQRASLLMVIHYAPKLENAFHKKSDGPVIDGLEMSLPHSLPHLVWLVMAPKSTF